MLNHGQVTRTVEVDIRRTEPATLGTEAMEHDNQTKVISPIRRLLLACVDTTTTVLPHQYPILRNDSLHLIISITGEASADLSSFQVLDAKDLQAPLALADPRKIWLRPAYPGPWAPATSAQLINLH
ncbi:hypothetical protein TNCV_4184811 [Trichonephila clavipes]|nr:hypothetical protein TNCV_4184811 [Trichonephila clavipes]